MRKLGTVVVVCLVVVFGSVKGAAQLQFTGPAEIGAVTSDKLLEISGVAASRNSGVLWVHNDGATDKVYALSSGGALLATYDITRGTTDLEDIAFGPGPIAGTDYLYIGDIGSNEASRHKVRIYRTAEPVVDLAWASDPKSRNFENVDRFELTYPGTEEYNAEAMWVDPLSGDLYIITKMATGAKVFGVAKADLVPETTIPLLFVMDIPFDNVSSAAISRDGRYLAIRREDKAQLWTRAAGQSIPSALQGTPVALPIVGPPTEANGEAISFLPDSTGYVTVGEGQDQKIYQFKIQSSTPPPAVRPAFTALPRLVQDRWLIAFRGSVGSVIHVEKSTDLINWSVLRTVTLSQETASVLDTRATHAFYRLRLGN